MRLHGPVEIIVNPISGHGRPRALARGLAAELERRGVDARVYETSAAGDATRRAGEIAASVGCVVACGGDGTVCEILEGLVGSDVPVLVAPAGNENLLAKEFGLPSTPAALAEVLLGEASRIVSMDLGEVNGREFHSIFSVGFDADVVARVARRRRGHVSHFSYVGPIAASLLRHRWPELRVWCEGRERFVGRGMVFVGNISRYATGLRIAQRARVDDGLLDVVILPCHSRLGLLRQCVRLMRGVHVDRRDVVYCQAEHVRIEASHGACSQVDGDVGPAGPWEISVRPGGCNLIVPGA